MNWLDHNELQQLAYGLRRIVRRGESSTPDDSILDQCFYASMQLSTLEAEISRIAMRRRFEPWEFRDLQAYVADLRSRARLVSRRVRCADGKSQVFDCFELLDKLSAAIDRVSQESGVTA